MELAMNLGVIFVFFILAFVYAFFIGNTMGESGDKHEKKE